MLLLGKRTVSAAVLAANRINAKQVARSPDQIGTPRLGYSALEELRASE